MVWACAACVAGYMTYDGATFRDITDTARAAFTVFFPSTFPQRKQAALILHRLKTVTGPFLDTRSVSERS